MKAVEIICGNCGKEALLCRESVYEGFAKVGERLFCSACGFEFASEAEVPFRKTGGVPRIFSESDRSEAPRLFEVNEGRRICRYCSEYTVNPFTQFCARWKREVEATDSCEDFHPGSAGERDSDDPA
jgi:hypothetical protein